jgi:hypothetical protein
VQCEGCGLQRRAARLFLGVLEFTRSLYDVIVNAGVRKQRRHETVLKLPTELLVPGIFERRKKQLEKDKSNFNFS